MHQHAVTAIILAAGASRRFGPRNKLLEPVEGKALVLHPVDAALAAGLRVAVVVPSQASALRDLLVTRPVTLVPNAHAGDGLATSIAAGIGALDRATAGAAILPGDMPNVTPGMLLRLVEAFQAHAGAFVIVPKTATGAQRNPVIWPAAWFARLSALNGDQGAKSLIPAATGERHDVVFSETGVFRDIDTVADLAGA